MFNNYDYTNNQNIKINSCSGGIYKNYAKSWFDRFNLKSNVADVLFRKEGAFYSVKRNGYTTENPAYYDEYRDAKEVIVLQMVICGENQVIAELIFKEDFEKVEKEK